MRGFLDWVSRDVVQSVAQRHSRAVEQHLDAEHLAYGQENDRRTGRAAERTDVVGQHEAGPGRSRQPAQRAR